MPQNIHQKIFFSLISSVNRFLTMFPNVFLNPFFKVSTLMIFLMHFAKNIFYFSTMMLPLQTIYWSTFSYPYLLTNEEEDIRKHTDKQTFTFFLIFDFCCEFNYTQKREREVGTFTIRFIDVTLIYWNRLRKRKNYIKRNFYYSCGNRFISLELPLP